MIGQFGGGLPQVGEKVGGKYRILRKIGQGGMGVVYAAMHEVLAEEVALKVLGDSCATPDAVKRFLNEGRAAAKIRGEHVAHVLDIGLLENGRPFICMELLHGEDLGQMLARDAALPPSLVADCLIEAMEALAQAHMFGIVHRDLKPSNLFYAQRPDGGRVLKVLDFGIAKAMGNDPRWASHTSTKAMVGSPLYMAPEQVRKSRNADAQSDIWALGAIAYELLTGVPPFAGDELGELFLAIVESTPAPLRNLRAGIPEALVEVVDRCLAKDREKRWKTVADLAVALRPFASAHAALTVDRVVATVSRGPVRAASTDTPPLGSVTGPAPDPPAKAAAEAPTLASEGVPPTPLPSGPSGRLALGRTGAEWADTGATYRQDSKKKTVMLWGALVGVVAAALGVLAIRLHASGVDPGPVAGVALDTAAPPPAPTDTSAASAASADEDAAAPASPSASAAIAPPRTPRVPSAPPPPRPAKPHNATPGKAGTPTITKDPNWP